MLIKHKILKPGIPTITPTRISGIATLYEILQENPITFTGKTFNVLSGTTTIDSFDEDPICSKILIRGTNIYGEGRADYYLINPIKIQSNITSAQTLQTRIPNHTDKLKFEVTGVTLINTGQTGYINVLPYTFDEYNTSTGATSTNQISTNYYIRDAVGIYELLSENVTINFPITIKVPVTGFTSTDYSNHKIFHYTGGTVTDITSGRDSYSSLIGGGYVYGQLNSFSTVFSIPFNGNEYVPIEVYTGNTFSDSVTRWENDNVGTKITLYLRGVNGQTVYTDFDKLSIWTNPNTINYIDFYILDGSSQIVNFIPPTSLRLTAPGQVIYATHMGWVHQIERYSGGTRLMGLEILDILVLQVRIIFNQQDKPYLFI